MEILRFKEVSFTYPTATAPALQEVSFSLEEGEFCLVLGASAAGKSTLLKLVKKEIAPFGTRSGEISVGGSVGFVFQNPNESMVTDRVRSELSFAPTHAGYSAAKTELLVAECAAYFHLEDKLDSDISTLSGGEKQMLALASVMIMQPKILVLDEPTASLDPVAAEQFCTVLLRLHRDFSTTILLSTHSAQGFAEAADSLLLLEKGTLHLKAPFDDALAQMQNENNALLGALPVVMRLFDGAATVADCRAILQKKTLLPLPAEPKEKPPHAVQAKQLYFAYDKGRDVLCGTDVQVYRGKINAVIGPNGSGKSTLLKVLCGVHRAYRGKVKTNGAVAMLTQNVFDLFTKDTCAEEVTFGEITDYLGIGDIRNKHPYDLSGGEAQRLALAKVLETGADILLLDEPTGGFDCVLKEKFAALLQDLCRQGKTVLLVSHDIEFVGEYCDYVSFLSGGKTVASDTRRAFFSSLGLYTTALSTVCQNGIVSVPDLKEAGGWDE